MDDGHEVRVEHQRGFQNHSEVGTAGIMGIRI